VSKGIDLMIKDIFAESNSVYNYIDYLNDTKKFIQLNDGILTQILYSKKQGLEQAKNLIKRIYTRDLYKFAAEIIVGVGDHSYDRLLHMTESDVVNCAGDLDVNDLRVCKLSLDFGKGDLDPVSFVKFYGENGEIVSAESNSMIVPSKFKELIVRVYAKNSEKIISIKNAFVKYCQEYTGENPSNYKTNSGKKLVFYK
jgi:hypothetical protein